MNKGSEPEFVIKFNDDTVIDSLVNLNDNKAMMNKEIKGSITSVEISLKETPTQHANEFLALLA